MNEIDGNSLFPSSLQIDPSTWSGIDRLRSACLGIILLDIETIFPVEEPFFTPREAARARRLGLRRQKSFTAARVALKRLARQLDLVEKDRSEQTIETLGPDEVKPCLAESGVHCSASHSGRLVVAVAHRHPIGVDIERASEKVVKTRRLSMSPRERELISLSSLGQERAAARVWTAKEASGKALGLQLFQALREVEVVQVGEEEGTMTYQGKTYPVRHAEGNGYVITLITCDDL